MVFISRFVVGISILMVVICSVFGMDEVVRLRKVMIIMLMML